MAQAAPTPKRDERASGSSNAPHLGSKPEGRPTPGRYAESDSVTHGGRANVILGGKGRGGGGVIGR
ncbi:hypothetical protein FIBSPDRAFT_1036779 [Athelia psychrophila]|uniref:Uncharacterized protein n=1 Tax=Athelia psychrophila TaxID=1759441 RepID=A0A166VFN1_9AGAM|nr:hypothetical protein FIBSPDRAFT_1036779 [Fibularhizoctonia sp. CBS 109695]